MSDLTLPSNVEAERYVLGSCMLSPRALDEVSGILTVRDLYETRNATTYAAMRRLQSDGNPTDVLAVTDELIRSGDLIGNLTADYLHALTGAVSTAANAGYYAEMVSDAAQRRHVIEGGQRAIQVAMDPSVPVAEVAGLARDAFERVEVTSKRGTTTLAEAVDQHTSNVTDKKPIIPTPWYDLNGFIKGFRDESLYVIAARPAGGKSIMALQAALDIAKHRPVLFVSMEMSAADMAARAISAHGQIGISALSDGDITDADWKRIADHRRAFADLRLEFADSSTVSTVPEIKEHARAIEKRTGLYPAIFVDYLQLLRAPGRVESRQVEVSGITRDLKSIALGHRVPVVAMSQLNRAGFNRKGKASEPQLSDLRESGAIEQDADVVLLLHRMPVQGGQEELKVIVAKSRRGKEGSVNLVFQGQFSRVLSKYQAKSHLV